MKKGNFLARLIINALAFLIVSSVYPAGMHVNGFGAAVAAAFIWGIVNALLRPILVLLTFPINFLTFGLFTFVINGLMLLMTSRLYSGLVISGLFGGMIAAFLLSCVNVILTMVLVKNKSKD